MNKKTLNKDLSAKTLKIYWQHASKYKGLFSVVVLGIVGASSARLIEPFFYKKFFDILASPQASPETLVPVLYYILFVNSIGWVLHRFEAYCNIHAQSKVMADLLNTCFSYLHLHSFSFFNNNFGGSLVRKVTRYAKSFEDIADQFTGETMQTMLRIVGIVVILFFKHPYLGAIVLGWTVLFVVFNFYFSLWKLKFDIARSEQDTKITGQLADTITNNINLKLFGGHKLENKWFRSLTDDLNAKRIRAWTWGNWNDALQGGLMVLLEFAVMYTAVVYWQRGAVTIGDFALLQAYLVQMFQQLWGLGRHIRRIYENMADANEMTEILLTPHEIVDAPKAKKLEVKKGKIEFSGIHFAYQNFRNIFENFSLTIQPGEKVALIGPSGGGKSTITKLLFRFFDIQKGHISIDGQDIALITQDSLRNAISLVPQEPILFHRSLLENIRYARASATKEEIVQAAKLAHCHEFIASFPDGYDTYVGERGVKLSGGERQRVAIARAILKNAPILVLDEATSSLDSESEKLIQDALHTLMKGKTTIVIAHRLSTIMEMDRILVIDQGTITEEGKHEELLKAKQGTYQKLWEIQAGGFA